MKTPSKKVDLSPRQFLEWIKDETRSGDELIAACGQRIEADRIIASHPKAPTELLSRLSHSSDRATRARVTANPQSPAADLFRLGQQFPEEFLKNPALDLLLMENPALLEAAPQRLLYQILRADHCPPDFLTWAAGRDEEKLQLAVVMNPKTPPNAIEKLRKSVHKSVRQALEAVGEGPEAAGSQDPEVIFRKAVCKRLEDMKLDDAVLAWRKGDIGLAQYRCLALSTRLALNGIHPRVAVQVAERGVDTLDLLQNIARSPEARFRELAAASVATPLALLQTMADDAFAAREAGGVDTGQILEGIARNPNASLTLLEQLRSKTGALTRELAANPNCSNELLTRLIASDPIWAKIGLAENPKTEEKQRRSLMEEVANAMPPRNSRDDVITAIASNNRAPNWWLEAAAAADLGWSVSYCLAGNPSTPPDALVRLARIRHGSILVRCAGNPSTPIQALEELIEGKHSDLAPTLISASKWACDIRKTAASNPSLPRALLDRLIKHPSTPIRAGVLENEGAPIEWLESAAKLANVTFRRSVAGNQRTPAKILANLASDSDLWVRVQLLLNASTPIETATHIARRLFGNSLQELNWINKQFEKSTEQVKQACVRGDVLFANLRERKYAVPTYLASPRPLAALMMVSAGPVIPPRQLIRHARSTDWLLRAAVARNRATPNKQLKKLAKDVHPLVADFARKTLVSTLEYCEGSVSIDKARVVREISSYRGMDFSDPFWIFFSPPEPLRLIISDPLPKKLIYQLFGQFLGQLTAGDRINFATSLAKNKFLDEIEQEQWWNSLPRYIRDIFSEFYDELPLHLIKALEGPAFFSLGFRGSNARLLSMLATVGSTSMKEDVARNLHCSRDTLAALAKSRSASVRKVVEDRLQLDSREPTNEENDHAELTVGNAGVSPESQQQEWDESQEQLGTKVIALIRLALQRESIGDDEFEAHCDRLSMEDLIRAAKSVLESREDSPTASVYSPHWGLRLLAAIHPDTSEEQRRLLTWDDDPDVSALARRLSGDRRAIPL